jgi:hypothetical protein
MTLNILTCLPFASFRLNSKKVTFTGVHLEAKDIGIALKGLEKKDQMKRYFNALGNLILTDHLEFRWYVGGELRLSAAIATFDKQKKIKADADGIAQADQLLRQFLLIKVVQVTTPKALAKGWRLWRS